VAEMRAHKDSLRQDEVRFVPSGANKRLA